MNRTALIIISILLGYFIGSVPFALVIGKLFYHTDVREHGSGNLGGGNTGRVLGKKAGVAVMTLDLLKVSFVVLLVKLLGGDDLAVAAGGLAAGLGHCFTVFARFKGGKAVAAVYGFLFGLFVFAGRSPWYFFLPLLVFLLVLFLTRIIALASMISVAAVNLYVWLRPEVLPVRLVLLVYLFLIIVRHLPNIRRMLEHRENRISWMPSVKERTKILKET